ncbi:efflux RND transporter periplasmic adaptor subunit [Rothia sp. P5764]|uniref:efflux RND transporter periplasmic adaptor subunit n=2 Tax=unclassified Rothia (in: high G+C Gram-positive bacteria) TaxID=2689056 RepID=UPI003AD5F900
MDTPTLPMDQPPAPPVPAHRPRKKKKMSTLTKVLIAIAAGVVALILVGVLVFSSLFGASSTASGGAIPATDYMILSKEGVSNKVRVEGTIQPGEIRSVTTHLTSPISAVNVAVGDRVEMGQTLATIDTSTLQGELDTQRVQLEGAVTTAQTALKAAQTAYDQHNQGINNGTNPEILAALAAQRTAAEQLTQANNSLATARTLRDQAAAEGADLTALNADLAAAESAQRLAAGAKSDADSGVSTARNAASTQLATLEAELGNARTSLTSAERARDQALTSLQEDIDGATITSPINGVVMTVAKPGAPATGPVVTIGDDSKLTITSSVRESDLPKVKEGNKVTFTAGSSGTKEYTGTVTSVASIADSAQQAGSEAAGTAVSGVGTGSSPTFTVTIEVTGDREGLYLGSSVKANIITAEETDSLAVPVDAVYTNDLGAKSVVVAVPQDGGNYVLEERTVETGLANDIDIAITGGELAEGDMVLTYGENYRYRVGETVTLDAGVSYGW